ncbi:MAG: DUF2191 domain-containing protein [Deltaproteobacteria bacterium]|nr:DUF2191 domain-containing protein [Deltaproteobacteria bacterium]
MRTTLTIDEDISQKIKTLSNTLKKPFKTVVNHVLRLGLKQVKSPPATMAYVTEARPLCLKKGINLDNIQHLLSEIEGEDQR